MGAGDEDRGKVGDAGGESPAGSPQSSREVMALVSAGDAGKGAVSDDAPGNKSGSRPRAPPRAADPDAIDALRRYVCRVLSVDVEGEGDALVPPASSALGATRVDWARVDAACAAPASTHDDARDGARSRSERGGAARGTAASGSSAAPPPRSPPSPSSSPLPREEAEGAAEAVGRVGPPRVEVDRAKVAGDVRLDASGTSVTSRGNFASVRANACVFAGRWAYEATLGSSGIMQLGWATDACPFTHEHGVGDARDSYAYDGHRVRKWNVGCAPYGQAWVAGDVITCAIDLTPGADGGTVTYYRNGVSLGVAFENVRRFRGPGSAYYPAASLSLGERCALNFGDAPLRYPLPGYAPLQRRPTLDAALHARAWSALEAMASVPRPPAGLSSDEECLLAAAALGRACGDAAAPGTSRRVAREFALPALLRAAARAEHGGDAAKPPPGRVDRYERGVRLLCAAMDPEELAAAAPELMRGLAEWHRSAPLARPATTGAGEKLEAREFSSRGSSVAGEKLEPFSTVLEPAPLPALASHAPLACAVAFARHAPAFDAWVAEPGWGADIEGLLARRIPNAVDLAEMLPQECVHWPGAQNTEPEFHEEEARWSGFRGGGDVVTGSSREGVSNPSNPSNASDDASGNPSGRAAAYPGCPGSEAAMRERGAALAEATARTTTLQAALLLALARRPPPSPPPRTPGPRGYYAGHGPRGVGPPGVPEEELPADPTARAFVEARRAAAATAAATAASAAAGDPGAALRDQSFEVDEEDAEDPDGGFAGDPAGSDSARARALAKSDTALTTFLRWLAKKNESDARRAPGVPPPSTAPGHSDPTVLASAYFALIALLHPHAERLDPSSALARPPPETFWDSLGRASDAPLFGGGQSYADKTYPRERDAEALRVEPYKRVARPLTDASLGFKRPGEEEGSGASSSSSSSSFPSSLALLGRDRVADSLGACGMDPGSFPADGAAASAALPLPRLWDAAQLLYHLGASAHFKAAAYQLQTQIQAAQQLEAASSRLRKAEQAARDVAESTRATMKSAVDEFATRTTEALEERMNHSRDNDDEGEGGDGSDEASSAAARSARSAAEAEAARDAIVEANARLATASAEMRASTTPANELLVKLRAARATLRDDVVEAARLCWWQRAALHRPDQRAGMFAVVAYGAALLLAAMDRRGKGRRKRDPGAEEKDPEEKDARGDDARGDEAPSQEEACSQEEARSEEDVRSEEEDDSDHSSDDSEDPEKNRGALLPHVSAYHLESLMDAFHALRRGDPPLSPTAPEHLPGVHGVVTLLARHFADDRVANPDVRDAMLQSVSVLLQYPEYVAVFERNEEATRTMVPALLRAFDSRFWIPVGNILLRLCKGAGFGQEKAADPIKAAADAACDAQTGGAGVVEAANSREARERGSKRRSAIGASPLFRRRIVDACVSDPKLLAEFLDRLFNTLNWTITELGVTLKEMLETRDRVRPHDARQLRRKCTVMFELSVTLERVLECFALELPGAFLNSDASLDLGRLTESLVFVLGHTTVGPDATLFDRALTSRLAPVDKVSRAPILAPVAGILLALDAAEARAVEDALERDEESEGRPRTDDALSDDASDASSSPMRRGPFRDSIASSLANSSCDVAQLEYLRDFPWWEHFSGENENLARLGDFARRVKSRREDVERMRETEDARSVPDEFVDPIMQTVMTDPVTLPGSGQTVDRATIKRHLMSDGTDPFSRSPLDESMLVPAEALRERIEAWRREAPEVESLADID